MITIYQKYQLCSAVVTELDTEAVRRASEQTGWLQLAPETKAAEFCTIDPPGCPACLLAASELHVDEPSACT